MNEIIEVKIIHGELRVDSRVIANQLGIQHKNLIDNIRNYLDKFQILGSVAFETETRKRAIGASVSKYVFLNEDQAVFLLTLSRNTEQVVDCKFNLTIAFKSARDQAQPQLPYHIRRYLANAINVPKGHFAILPELCNRLISQFRLITLGALV